MQPTIIIVAEDGTTAITLEDWQSLPNNDKQDILDNTKVYFEPTGIKPKTTVEMIELIDESMEVLSVNQLES